MITALIMAGGEGTRFWPLSRASRPKQFLMLTDDQKTMLQETVKRIQNLVPPENIFIATNEKYKEGIRTQLQEIPVENIIIEPLKRNTAPSIALSSLYIDQKKPGSTMIVLPADHLINDEVRFINVLRKAVMTANAGDNLVTLGVEPTHPETGYGYIHYGELYHTIDNDKVYRVNTFTEKPDMETARQFLKQGTFLWNSGMFIWQTEVILNKIEEYMPELYASLNRIRPALGTDLEEKVVYNEFEKLESVSIDYGIMEKAADIFVIPGDFGWDDLGSWPALERVKKVDQEGNIVMGKHYGIDTKDSIIHSLDKVVTTIGLKDIVIVDTREAILVCDKKRAQEVKEIRQILKENGMEECL